MASYLTWVARDIETFTALLTPVAILLAAGLLGLQSASSGAWCSGTGCGDGGSSCCNGGASGCGPARPA